MAKTYRHKRTSYKRRYRRTNKRTNKRKVDRRRKQLQLQLRRRTRKQRRGGTPTTQTTQTKIPSILLGPYRHSGEECIKKMIKATPLNDMTLERLRDYPAVLNTYAMLLLTAPNSITYRNQMKPAVKAFIDDINKHRLLEYQQLHSKSNSDPQAIKGDLRQLNAGYVAEILSPSVNKNATIQDIIDWLTSDPEPTQPTATQPTPIPPPISTAQSTPIPTPIPTPTPPQPTATPATKEKVLVLCQRKLDENGAELVNKDIDNLLDALNIGADRDIKYASPMDEHHIGEVDFEGEFGGVDDFTTNNFTKGDYSVIILNTCPFRSMEYGIISEYLKPNGRIVLSKFDKKNPPTNFVEEQPEGKNFYQRISSDAKDNLSDAGFELDKTYKDALVFRRKNKATDAFQPQSILSNYNPNNQPKLF